jgi:N-acetylneuraminate synthase
MKKERCFIIAEAGVNHNGDLDTAFKLVDAACEAGADAVKFQTFNTDQLVTTQADKAAYQKLRTADGQSQYAMLKQLELSEQAFVQLFEYCQSRSIQFLSTAFDFDSLAFLLKQLSLDYLKIPSGEITNGPFLLAHARTGKEIILSTGMATLADIELALRVLAFGFLEKDKIPTEKTLLEAYVSSQGQKLLREKVILLHCTSEYPAPAETINLRVMDSLSQAFGLKSGYSDHSQGIAIAIAAAARGAKVIEKHFTLDKNLPGPDHQASLAPDELKAMVDAIRMTETALGSTVKIPQPSELETMKVARKSLVARCQIAKGEPFSATNLGFKRPGTGLSPMHYWRLLGKRSQKAYEKDEVIDFEE